MERLIDAKTAEASATAAPPRATRSIAWVLLLGSAAAVLVAGLAATALVLSPLSAWPTGISVPLSFWAWLVATSFLTLCSLGLRALRWIFLLRRTETRIPIHDAYVGYLAGLSLLLAPFLLGETAVRAYVLRVRGRVPISTTVVVNVWERMLDLVALALLGGVASAASGDLKRWQLVLAALAATTFLGPVRRLLLTVELTLIRSILRAFRLQSEAAWDLSGLDAKHFDQLALHRNWLVAFATSVVAWSLPGIALRALVGSWGSAYGFVQAQAAYAGSALAAGIVLAPGGVVVAGQRLLVDVISAGLAGPAAALTVVAIRFATLGVATSLGVVFLFVHWRSRRGSAAHFDAIAESYDVQIPEARRLALLEKKTELMQDVIAARGIGGRGLDVGCGQGWYLARMRARGFDVTGIDASAAQVELAARNIGDQSLVRVGSVLEIPAADASYDFVYLINVLHHLSSIDEQRAAFEELLRVLRPGGLLFLHEINTRNVLFRFYMGYVFPSLNCIDEGVERWLLPNRLDTYTSAPLVEVRYFTFLPEFVPSALVRLLGPAERALERSRVGMYSAHYMAVMRKPA